MDKSEPLYTVHGNVKWYSQYGKHYGGSSKKFEIELLYDPAIPFLAIHPKELKGESQGNSVHPCSQQHYSQ